MSPCTPFRRWW